MCIAEEHILKYVTRYLALLVSFFYPLALTEQQRKQLELKMKQHGGKKDKCQPYNFSRKPKRNESWYLEHVVVVMVIAGGQSVEGRQEALQPSQRDIPVRGQHHLRHLLRQTVSMGIGGN